MEGRAIALDILPHTGKIPKLLESLEFLLDRGWLNLLAPLPVLLASVADVPLKLRYAEGTDRDAAAEDSDEMARVGLLRGDRRILLGSFGEFVKVVFLDLLQCHVGHKFWGRNLLAPRNDEVECFIEGGSLGNRKIALFNRRSVSLARQSLALATVSSVVLSERKNFRPPNQNRRFATGFTLPLRRFQTR